MNPVTSLNAEGNEQMYIPADILWELPINDLVDVPDGPLAGLLTEPAYVANYEPGDNYQAEYLRPGTEVWVLAFIGGMVYIQKPESLMFAFIPTLHVEAP